MRASGRHLPAWAACALVCAAVAGCGSGGKTRTAATVDEAAAPSAVIGAKTASYPPADPVTVVSCASPRGGSYCTDPSGLRVSAVNAGEPCHVAIDPPGVRSGSWRSLGAGDTHLACGAGVPGRACAVSAVAGTPPAHGAWNALGACVTPAAAGAACGVDARTQGVWTRAAGTDAAPRYRCAAAH